MAKEFNDIKMWESIRHHLLFQGQIAFVELIDDALKDQGFKWDGKHIVPIDNRETTIPEIVEEHYAELVDLVPEANNMTEFEIRFAGIMCKEIPVYALCTEKSVIIAQKYSKELISIARKQFIKEACEWLSKNADEYTWCHEDGRSGIGYNMIGDFRNALEEGDK